MLAAMENAAADPILRAAEADPKSCALRKLAAELRNRIYREALVETDNVCISRRSHQQHALLWTCHKIRKEASGIYACENSFQFEVVDMTPMIPRKSTGHWSTRNAIKTSQLWGFVPIETGQTTRHWDNLKSWVQDWMQGELPGALHAASAGEHGLTVVSSVFDAADQMRLAGMD